MTWTRRVLAVPLAAVALAAPALGYWASTGSGSGSASATTPMPVTIAPVTAAAQLLPTGAATGDVTLAVTNPNSYRVHVNQLALDTSQGSGGFSANATGCALSFAPQTNAGSGWDIPGGATVELTLAGSVTMGTAAASSCQGQAFTVYLAAS